MKTFVFVIALLVVVCVRTNASSTLLQTTMTGPYDSPVDIDIRFTKDADNSVTAHFLGAQALMPTAACIEFTDPVPSGYRPDVGNAARYVAELPYNSNEVEYDGFLYVYANGDIKFCRTGGDENFAVNTDLPTGPTNSAVTWTTPSS